MVFFSKGVGYVYQGVRREKVIRDLHGGDLQDILGETR